MSWTIITRFTAHFLTNKLKLKDHFVSSSKIFRPQAGAWADLVVLAPDTLAPRRVMLGGRWV